MAEKKQEPEPLSETEQAQEALDKAIDAAIRPLESSGFWDVPTLDLPMVVLLQGPTKTGKTHWAAHAGPGVVFLADTDMRGAVVVAKARKSRGHDAVFWKQCRSFDDVRQVVANAYAWKLQNPLLPATLVFDSASDLQRMAETEYLAENPALKKVWPKATWSKVYRKMDLLIECLKRSGFSVVFCAREKDEYEPGDDGQRTGRQVVDGYKRLPYLSDVHLRLIPTKGSAATRCVVLGNGLGRQYPPELPWPMGWDDLRSVMVTGEAPANGGV